MSANLRMRLVNGLGDKMLDMIGMYVICKKLGYNPCAHFCNGGQYAWGHNTYDLRLFRPFQDITVWDPSDNTPEPPYYAVSHDPSSSVCPYRVWHFLRDHIPGLTFDQISEDFARIAQELIQPSDIISRDIPADIEGAYGIHLRKSDKLTEWGNVRHENTTPEFETIVAKLLEDVRSIVQTEQDTPPKFLIVSEDEVWKEEIRARIREIGAELGREVLFIYPNYDAACDYQNYRSVMDMFCLSRCREILQGVKFSTFSILAALVGGRRKLRNYSRFLETDHMCLIYIWGSVISINMSPELRSSAIYPDASDYSSSASCNGAMNRDLESHARMTECVKWVETNITGPYLATI